MSGDTTRSRIRSATQLAAVGLLGLLIGFGLRGCFRSGQASGGAAEPSGEERHAAVWTCSMHPQIRQPKPGKCPICGMDLIPVGGGAEEKTGPSELVMSPSARKLADIRLTPVERRFVEVSVRMVGTVQFDYTVDDVPTTSQKQIFLRDPAGNGIELNFALGAQFTKPDGEPGA